MSKLKHFYLNKVKGWREEDLCGCTLLFEGTAAEVATQQQDIYQLAKVYGGLPAGSKNGERGYQMTFMIAYLRCFPAPRLVFPSLRHATPTHSQAKA